VLKQKPACREAAASHRVSPSWLKAGWCLGRGPAGGAGGPALLRQGAVGTPACYLMYGIGHNPLFVAESTIKSKREENPNNEGDQDSRNKG